MQQIEQDEQRIRKQLEAAPEYQGKRFWEPWEENILRDFWNRRDHALIAKLIGRSLMAARNHADQLGLNPQHRGGETA